MSQFQATKCDECGRIQGESNHWQKIQVWFEDQKCVGVVLLADPVPSATIVGGLRDLCGQGCTLKHLAKLLGWTVKTESD